MGDQQPVGRPDRPTVTPRIITPDPSGLAAFSRAAFEGSGEGHGPEPIEVRIGDSIVMISDGGGVREPMAAFLVVYVADVDATYATALALGAESIEPPEDMPWGDRRATVRDSWNNLWQIAAPLV